MFRQKVIIIMMSLLCLGIQGITDSDSMPPSADQTVDITIDDAWRKSDLPREECPDYDYFTNAQQGHYNLTLENTVAFIVKDYASEAGLSNEEWELKKIYFCEGVYQAFVESASRNELYIAFMDGIDQYDYSVIADIRRGEGADKILNGSCSYNSMQEWHSYTDWLDDGKDMLNGYRLDITPEIHDSIYSNGTFYALYDYLDKVGINKKSRWEVDGNDVYVGRNGCIVSVTCRSDTQTVNLIVDVANKLYAVLK